MYNEKKEVMHMTKKIALILIISTIFCALACVLVACTPAKIEKIVGTYEISIYSRQKDSSSPLEDLIDSRKITAYIVLKEGGVGYFVYADSDNAISAREVALEYTYSSDDPQKVSTITFSDKDDFVKSHIGWSATLHVNYQGKKESYLTCQKIAVGSLSPSSGTTTYTRVDKATDLSFVQNKLGVQLDLIANN